DEVHLVPPGFPQLLNLATIEHVKVPKYDTRPGGRSPVVGRMRIDFAYGPTRERLSYKYSYEADLQFGWTVQPPDKLGRQQAQVFVSTAIKRNRHEMSNGP